MNKKQGHPREYELLSEEEMATNIIQIKKNLLIKSAQSAISKGMKMDLWLKLKGIRMGFKEIYSEKEQNHFIAFFSRSWR